MSQLGEFSHCECASHIDANGTVTRRPYVVPPPTASGIERAAAAHRLNPIEATLSPLAIDRARSAGVTGREFVVAQRRTHEAQVDIAAARAMPTDVELEAQLSDAELSETQAVREMVGATPPLPPGAIVLTGADAERYRAMQAAARAAQEATQAVQKTGIALRDAFQAFCAGVTPAKEP